MTYDDIESSRFFKQQIIQPKVVEEEESESNQHNNLSSTALTTNCKYSGKEKKKTKPTKVFRKSFESICINDKCNEGRLTIYTDDEEREYVLAISVRNLIHSCHNGNKELLEKLKQSKYKNNKKFILLSTVRDPKFFSTESN